MPVTTRKPAPSRTATVRPRTLTPSQSDLQLLDLLSTIVENTDTSSTTTKNLPRRTTYRPSASTPLDTNSLDAGSPIILQRESLIPRQPEIVKESGLNIVNQYDIPTDNLNVDPDSIKVEFKRPSLVEQNLLRGQQEATLRNVNVNQRTKRFDHNYYINKSIIICHNILTFQYDSKFN